MTMGTYTTIGVVEESSWGVTPASALQLVNASGIKMPGGRKRERPNVLTGDRRRYPARVLEKLGDGLTIPMPLQFENDLLFLEGLMNNSRASAVTVTATTIAFATGSPDQITDSGSGLTNFASGDLIYASGVGAGTNADQWFGPIIKVDNGTLTIPSGQIADQAAGGSVTLRTRRLTDGATLKSYSTEYRLSKLSNFFRNQKGGRVLSAKHSWAQGAYATAEYVLNGAYPLRTTSTIGTGGPTAAKSSPFLTSTDDFQLFKFGGYGTTLNDITVTKWDVMFKNLLATIKALGNVGPSGIDVGPFDVDVDLSVYMDDNAKDLVDAANDSSDPSLWCWWALVDPSGNRWAYSLPACKVDVDDVPVDSAEGQVAINAKLTAHDPAKDDDSEFHSSGFNQQAGLFFVPAP